VLSVAGCGQPPKDVTAVVGVTATSAEPAPALSTALLQTLRSEADHSQQAGVPDVRIVRLGAAPLDIDLTPMRGEEVENDSAQRAKLIGAAFTSLSGRLAGLTASREQLDDLDTLRAAAEAGSGLIYLLTSGVSTVDPVNLAALGWAFNPKAVAADLRQRGLLPHLDGRSVTFVGLGRVAGAQPALAQPEEDQVKALWLAICQSAGAAHCAVDDSSQAAAAPTATWLVSVVPVPRHGTTSVDLPTDVLFGPDSAVLLPQADVPLRGLADQLIACGAGARVDLVGHVADVVRGIPDNGPLSGERAEAVAQRLRQLGVPASAIGSVSGAGDSQPLVDNWTGGRFDEAKAARNRRVTLTITC
jgi:outer membrane protein OmpA-like peptidoglycan-associated protein